MIASPWTAAACGAALGTLNGWASRYALKKAFHRSNTVFYSIFAAGFFWRLLCLVGSVWYLRNKKYIIILPFAAALVFTQFIFEVVPLKKDGTKDDT